MSAPRAAALVRRWVSLYTRGLPPEIRQDRRDEIDDDLWCQAQEAAESGRAGRSLAGEITARLVFGIPADLSWRIEQTQLARIHPTPERRISMHARPPAVLAIVGGAMWTITPIGEALTHALSGAWQGGPGQTLTLVSALGGTVVLALATITLVAAAQDMLSSRTATLAVIGAAISTLVVFAVGLAIFALPLSSALVVWQLSRVGALPKWTFWMHVVAPLFAIFVVGLAGLLPGGDAGPARLALVVLGMGALYLYPLSWLAIGWSLLRGGTVAPDGMAGASAA